MKFEMSYESLMKIFVNHIKRENFSKEELIIMIAQKELLSFLNEEIDKFKKSKKKTTKTTTTGRKT